MTDARRRQRSRKAAAGLDGLEAEVLRLVEDTRAGALDPRFVALAAVLGDPAARAAYPAWQVFSDTELVVATCVMAPGFHYGDGLCEVVNWLSWLPRSPNDFDLVGQTIARQVFELALTRIQRVGSLWDPGHPGYLEELIAYIREDTQRGYAADHLHMIQRARQDLVGSSQALLDERADETSDLIGLLLNRPTLT